MPADAKRKEARKRKFGTQMTEPKPKPESKPAGTLNVEQERSSMVVPPKKRSKRAQLSQQGSEHTISTDKDEGQALQKAQRFIVFIGTYIYPELILASLADAGSDF